MILALDAAVKQCSVALFTTSVIVDEIVEANAFNASEKINVLIQNILQRNNITMQDIEAVAITNGPGSYTGLRIVSAAAKAICYALNIPLITCSTLLVSCYAHIEVQNKYDYFIPTIDARRDEVFMAIYDKNFKEVLADQPYIVTNESPNFINSEKKYLIFGNGAEKFKKLSTLNTTICNDTNY
ncbi:MAG: tRNA (adenosine(37)-N6)-threonylcarbamoyltransferase complex dimerization subunit type 1 TsaB, partial [Romboutsia sp.]|nr:tRNA (adenosine(37)-N6)-threonylcarbamoyltransferase complex dimerization subunit type 1 TsaB [Romboutsia sp.]